MRIAWLGSFPRGLHMDEVSFAYNAWSLAETGRDEFGSKWPLTVRAFDDWRPPVYPYMVAGLMKALGPSDMVERLPAAVAGVALIGEVYWLARELVNKEMARIAAMLVAVNPAFVFMSRVGFDASVALVLVVGGLAALLCGIRTGMWSWWVVSVVSLGSALMTYQACKVFVPLMLAGVGWLMRKELRELLKRPEWIEVEVLGTGVLVAVWMVAMFAGGGLVRFEGVSVFGEERLVGQSVERLARLDELGLALLTPLANRRVVYVGEVWARYLDSFNPGFWFAPTASQRLFALPGLGFSYPFELGLLILGGYLMWQREKKEAFWVVVMLILVAPVPAAVVGDVALLRRLLPMMVGMLMLVAYGVWRLERWGKWLAGVYGVSVVAMGMALFVWLPREQGELFPGYYREMVEEVTARESDYGRVLVSNKLTAPYIYFLWYGRVEPAEYLRQGGTKTGDIFRLENNFGKYEFGEFAFGELGEGELAVGLKEEFGDVDPRAKFGCGLGEECVYMVEIARE